MNQNTNQITANTSKMIAGAIGSATGKMEEDIPQKELKEYVREQILNKYNVDILETSAERRLKASYESAFNELAERNDISNKLLKDLYKYLERNTPGKLDNTFYNDLSIRKNKVKLHLDSKSEPLKGIGKIGATWGESRIREIAILIGESFDELYKLANSPKNVTNVNASAEAIISSRSLFMTKNRHQQVEDFKTELEKEKVILVAGERGSGKTLFLNVFIQKYHADYKHIIYLTVKAGQIVEGFVKSIGDYLGVSFQASEESPEEQLSVALMQLKKRNPVGMLVCIDNANNPDALDGFLNEWNKYPFLDDIRLIITTFCISNKAITFELTPLQALNAEEIFDRIVKRDEAKRLKQSAIQLFKHLGYNPILVEQVCMLLENNRRIGEKDLKEIKGLYNKEAQTPTIKNPDQSKQYYDGNEKTVIGFIKALFSKMAEETTKDEQLLLQYFSLLPAKPWSEHELLDIMPIAKSDLEKADALVRKGWLLSRDNGFFCHELYQIAVRELFAINIEEIRALLEKLEVKIRMYHIDEMEKSLVETLAYIPLAEAIVENLPFQKEEIKYADIQINQKLMELENCSGAMHPNDHSVLSKFLSSLGYTEHLLTIYNKALYYSYNGLRMQLRLQAHNSWEYGYDLLRFANLIQRENKKEALKFLEKTQLILNNDSCTPAWLYVRYYSNLGLLYRAKGLFQEAEEALKKVLTICGDEPTLQFDKATALDRLGLVYGTFGRKASAVQHGAGKENSEKSLAYRKQALELRLKIHNEPDNLKVAAIYNNMGAIYSRLERLDESIKSYKECIRIRVMNGLPLVHNSFAIVYNNMATALAKKVSLGQCEEHEKPALLEEAYSYFEKGLEIRAQLLDKDSDKFGYNYYAKARILFEKGKLEKQLEHFKEAIAAAELAIAYKNKADEPVRHEILELENLILEIKSEIQKLENEPKN